MKPMDDNEVLSGFLYGCSDLSDKFSTRRWYRGEVSKITKLIKTKKAMQFVETQKTPYNRRQCQLYNGRVVWTTTVGVHHPSSASTE
jgi:hypothetical protein